MNGINFFKQYHIFYSIPPTSSFEKLVECESSEVELWGSPTSPLWFELVPVKILNFLKLLTGVAFFSNLINCSVFAAKISSSIMAGSSDLPSSHLDGRGMEESRLLAKQYSTN